jgi:hypothetical protein
LFYTFASPLGDAIYFCSVHLLISPIYILLRRPFGNF